MVVPRPWRPGRYRLVQWGEGEVLCGHIVGDACHGEDDILSEVGEGGWRGVFSTLVILVGVEVQVVIRVFRLQAVKVGVVTQVVVEDFFGDVFEGAGEVDVFFPRSVGVRSTGDGVGGHFGFPFRLCGAFPVFLSYIYYYTRRNYGAQGFWGRKKKTTPIRGATNSTEEKK